ncbi:peptidoglycan recognition protein 3-like [Vombatus ursinus]|uniref:Peptidoglycan recognition protein 3 n=1 Tax=Vombatus ursinus TaxID=29139 RepID=A0A4X2JMB5_VOMUR|nr:peptidoglycan recognition protein 3-like [Vombatus ursinus]XP_027727225.1 peptidoglycan recognition protein 3-like [Vombatus ursinus]XP_027727231.1 peptidoglycan recognition protein 3-like [Vombatus ursinus]XP_027727232.1 peptidoglycan recognition protein 3-like [Vombatus ursinus]
MFVWFLFFSILGLGHCDDIPNLLISNESKTDSTANDFQNLINNITLLIKKVKMPYGGSFRMIPRPEWGAGPSGCSIQLRSPIPYLIIHHIPGQECHEKSTCQQKVKGLQELHVKTNGWCDVAYNFLIGDDGNVYEGVGWTIQGTHTVGYNDKSLGFAFVGSIAGSSPSAAALAAAENLTSFAVYRGYLSSRYIQPLFVQSESCLASQKNRVSKKECPDIIPRSSWGARETYCAKLLGPAKYVIIIHTAGHSCNVTEECKITVQNIQSYHIDRMKFCDIGYNFLVGEDGRVYEGVGWDTEGAHTYSYNDIGLGIAFIGLFTGTSPNAAALKVAQDLIQCAVDKGYLIPDYLLVGHSDVVNTLSPGQALYDKIKTWPHFKH